MIKEVVRVTQKGSFVVLCKCHECGKEFERFYRYAKRNKHQFCSAQCMGIWYTKNYSGDNAHAFGKCKEFSSGWKGGKTIGKRGYWLVLKPEHPYCDKNGYVMEHRLVMEKAIGRYLKPEEKVHHINEIKTDNRLNNLMLFKNHSEHVTYHHRILDKQNIA